VVRHTRHLGAIILRTDDRSRVRLTRLRYKRRREPRRRGEY